MPETTPLIKAALNLRVGAGFDVYIISLIIFFIIDSMKRNLKVMLQQHYVPYSEKRMNMTINVLKDYGIEIQNFDSLDMLIEEAKQAQIQCDYIAPLKKPFKTLGAIIIPIVAFVAQKIGNAASQDEMITMALQVIVLVLLTFSLIFSLTPIIKDILYRDYNKYDDFIYDLRQIKLFYAKKMLHIQIRYEHILISKIIVI